MRVRDATAEVPRRRMAVVRGSLQGARLAEGDAAAAQAACLATCKRAPELVATMLPYQLTHAECDVMADEAGIHVTVTLQAFARAALSPAAQLGAAAALTSIVERRGSTAGANASFQVSVVEDVVD